MCPRTLICQTNMLLLALFLMLMICACSVPKPQERYFANTEQINKKHHVKQLKTKEFEKATESENPKVIGDFSDYANVPLCGDHKPVKVYPPFRSLPLSLIPSKSNGKIITKAVLKYAFDFDGTCEFKNSQLLTVDLEYTNGKFSTILNGSSNINNDTKHPLCKMQKPSPLCYYMIGFNKQNEAVCVQRNSETPYLAYFHEKAPPLKNSYAEDPCSALGALRGKTANGSLLGQIRGTVKCDGCNSDYLRIYIGTKEGTYLDEKDLFPGDTFDFTSLVPGDYRLEALELFGQCNVIVEKILVLEGKTVTVNLNLKC